jgi:protein-S-isoprenylcysteine O-methyltransferase Ste14
MPGADHLVIRGVYKYLRHPIYIGIIFTILGLTVASGSVFGLIFLFVIVIPLNILRAYFEEKALLKKFGKEYEVYKSKTLF